MTEVKKTVVQTFYTANDGKEFTHRADCVRYEAQNYLKGYFDRPGECPEKPYLFVPRFKDFSRWVSDYLDKTTEEGFLQDIAEVYIVEARTPGDAQRISLLCQSYDGDDKAHWPVEFTLNEKFVLAMSCSSTRMFGTEWKITVIPLQQIIDFYQRVLDDFKEYAI